MTGLRVAPRWFERRSFADGVTLLWEPAVHPLVRCNIWHVAGRDRDLVIDTGVGVVPLRGEIEQITDRPVVALATHIHWDHVGGLHEFDTRLMHPREATRMAHYEEFATLTTSDLPAELVQALGTPEAPFDQRYLVTHAAYEGHDPDHYSVVSTAVTDEVVDGDGVDLGDRHFEVLHLPGHSPGSIGLWEEATRTLFSGDAIYDGVLLDDLPDSDVVEYVATMRRLRGMPARVVHGGHDQSFGRERLVELADGYLSSRA